MRIDWGSRSFDLVAPTTENANPWQANQGLAVQPQPQPAFGRRFPKAGRPRFITNEQLLRAPAWPAKPEIVPEPLRPAPLHYEIPAIIVVEAAAAFDLSQSTVHAADFGCELEILAPCELAVSRDLLSYAGAADSCSLSARMTGAAEPSALEAAVEAAVEPDLLATRPISDEEALAVLQKLGYGKKPRT